MKKYIVGILAASSFLTIAFFQNCSSPSGGSTGSSSNSASANQAKSCFRLDKKVVEVRCNGFKDGHAFELQFKDGPPTPVMKISEVGKPDVVDSREYLGFLFEDFGKSAGVEICGTFDPKKSVALKFFDGSELLVPFDAPIMVRDLALTSEDRNWQLSQDLDAHIYN